MITFKEISVVIALIFILAGCFLEFNGLSDGDTLLKIGLAIVLLKFIIGRIRIPRNSRGTPIGQEIVRRKIRSV